MKKLIFLSGESNSGKSTTLKMLIAKLWQQPALNTSEKYCRSKAKLAKLSIWKDGMPLPDGDLSVVLDCQGILVGICTDGDTIGAVWDHIVFFEKKQCIIGITACHPNHLDRSKPCMIASWGCHEVFKKDKASKGNEDKENAAMADALFQEIVKLINALNAQHP